MRKIIFAGLAIVFALAAPPVFADPYDWSGTGDKIPWEESPKYIVYPWFEWWGTLSEGTFAGNWAPDTPNYEGGGTLYRIFSGQILYYYTPEEGGPTYAHCEGEWTRLHDYRAQECGWFEMEFNVTDGTCEGVWGFVEDETVAGKMWGGGN